MIELRAATGYVKHAGAAIAIYKVTGAVRSGIQAGGAFFPGVTGLAPDPAVHVALFAFPYNAPATPPSVPISALKPRATTRWGCLVSQATCAPPPMAR